MADIIELKRALNNRVQDVAEFLLPRGVRHGREWCAGNTAGAVGDSLKVCLAGSKVGSWADFAANGESGDLIDLWCLTRTCTLIQALDQIRDWLGMRLPEFEERQPRRYRRPERPRCTTPRSAVLDYLTRERRLSPEAIRAYKLGEDGRMIILPSLLPEGTLAFVKYLNLDRSPEGKKITRVEPGCEPVLFGWQAIDPESRTVTLTEGELDTISGWQYGFPALSVPFGGGGGNKQAWIAAEFERLLRFEVIYLALDMDTEGEAAATAIADRLGAYRCRRVRLPRKDLNQCLQDGVPAEEIRAAFETAASLDPPELARPADYFDEVLRLFYPAEGQLPGYPLSFARIGDKVRFRPGELTEWTGATDAGKSQILSYALLPMAEAGARVCCASFEMPGREFLRRLAKQAGNVERPTESFLREIFSWFQNWLWLWRRQGKAEVGRILEVFEHARRRYGCDVFVIDSLMRLGVGSEDYEGQEKAVFQLVNFALEKNVHVHLVAHARKADSRNRGNVPGAEDVKGTSEIANNAANIIAIWRDRAMQEEVRRQEERLARGEAGAAQDLAAARQKPEVALNIAKQRNGDWEGKLGLWFDLQTYQYRSAHDPPQGRQFIAGSQVHHNLQAEAC